MKTRRKVRVISDNRGIRERGARGEVLISSATPPSATLCHTGGDRVDRFLSLTRAGLLKAFLPAV